MIIRLPQGQFNAIYRKLTPDLVEAMQTNRAACGQQHDYLLPGIAWRRILDQLTETSFGPLGGKLAGAESLYRAIAKIAERVGQLETHPALVVGRGVMGVRNEWIPAWSCGEFPNVTRSPYPADGRFTILRPRLESRAGRDITFWVESDPDPEDLLQQEAFHLRLRGEAEIRS